MNNPVLFRLSWRLSWLIVALAGIASAGGLLIPGLYRDNDFVRTAWLGNDQITLFVAVPALAIVLLRSLRGSVPAQLVWMGMLGYMLYNYAFYLFGAAFNEFFLLYVALFAGSVYALILGLMGLDVTAVRERFSEKAPVKGIAIFFLFIAIPLILVEGSQTVQFIRTGILPPIIVDTGQQTSVVFVLDMSVVIPAMLLSALLLWQRRGWGFVLGVVMLVKGLSYMLVLLLASAMLAGFNLSGRWDPLTPFYGFVALGSVLCLALLFRQFKTV